MAADIAVISSEKSYAVLIDESTWATMPGTPTRIHVPVTSCGVKFTPKRRNSQQRVGLFQRKYGRNVSGHPAGSLVTPLYGWHPTGLTTSLAQWLMEWGYLDQEATFPRSKILEWAEGPDTANSRHLGLRVNSATLAGSADNGISLTLDLIGESTANFATADTLPDNRNKLVEFLFEDLTFTLDSNVTPIGSFQWQVQRGLQPQYWDSRSPQSLPKSQWVETFSVTPPKQGHAWEDAVRALDMYEVAASLVLKGLHNGTGTGGTDWTVLTLTLPRLSLIDAAEAEQNGIYNEPLTFDVLKPDTSDLSSTMAWTEV
ncbi:MAG: hypothetical protein JSS49_27490 [Planctomycetes bacterium]|nr:hypothetical protein [Planctomycetota bacterium]